MSNQTTSFAQNVVNLNEIKERVLTFGLRYDPVNFQHSVEGMETLATNSQMAIAAANGAISNEKQSTGYFKMALNLFNKVITRSFNMLVISGANEQIVQQGRALMRDIRGQRVAVPKPPLLVLPAIIDTVIEPITNVRHISTSDFTLESMDRYVQFISGIDHYNPNEIDLKIGALNEMLIGLKEVNVIAKRNEAVSIAARRTRDLILFTKISGLYDVQKGVKLYTKAVFGPQSTEYISIRGFRFINKKLFINSIG